jgi:Flp pilus assembly protein TadD
MREPAEAVTEDTLVELGFLESVAARLPADRDVLKALGDLCTRVGRYEQGLGIDRRLSELCPEDPVVWYNLGCSLALLGRREQALEALARAVRLGYRDREWMRRDSDLRLLHGDEEFKRLLDEVESARDADA